MAKKLSASIAAVIIISCFIYYLLGGFESIDFYLESKSITVYGQLYEGTPASDKLSELFYTTRDLVKENKGYKLAIIVYPSVSEDSIKQYIGYVTENAQDVTSITINTTKFVVSELTAHPIVMPSPDEVRQLAEQFGKENQLTLEEYSLELYDSNGNLKVLYPTKDY